MAWHCIHDNDMHHCIMQIVAPGLDQADPIAPAPEPSSSDSDSEYGHHIIDVADKQKDMETHELLQ
jgi:hypothetical protein